MMTDLGERERHGRIEEMEELVAALEAAREGSLP